jgi:hypothetical protein
MDHPVTCARPPQRPHVPARFPGTSCSQCGEDFGAGNHGYSHCEDHADDASWPSASQIRRCVLANPADGHYYGPDRPGRYYAIVADEPKPKGLTAYLDADGDLRWVWDDVSGVESVWTPAWACYPAEYLIRNVGDGITEILHALSALHLHHDVTAETAARRLAAALEATSQACVGPEVSAYFALLAERRRNGWKPAS